MSGDFAGWYRVGGHRFQFYAATDELCEWLLETLPKEFAPYSVVGAEWRDGAWCPFEYPLAELRATYDRHGSGNRWIRSDVLSPDVPPGDGTPQSFGGLVLVQAGFEREGRIGEASIAVVDRIRHEETGEERRQPEYLRIFQRLRRSMRKRAVVRTRYRFPDGSIGESWPMTPRAAEAHARGGVQFDAEPVGTAP